MERCGRTQGCVKTAGHLGRCKVRIAEAQEEPASTPPATDESERIAGITEFAAAIGMQRMPMDGGNLYAHNGRLVLVDRHGHVRPAALTLQTPAATTE